MRLSNMTRQIELGLIKNECKIQNVTLELPDIGQEPYIKVLGLTSLAKEKYIGKDYFYILCEIRIDLEKDSLFLACKGCLKYVYPSGMSSEMTQGLVAYEASMDDFSVLTKVKIFDAAEENDFKYLTTVNNQKESRRELIRSGAITRRQR